MLRYKNFSWIFKTAQSGPPPGHPAGQPWQVSGGKWHAHSKPGDTSSPIIEVPPPTASAESETAPRPAEQESVKQEGFEGFDDPWKVMSPEDRKEANRLFKAAMRAFPSSPKQLKIREKLNTILDKYGIGKKASN